MRSRLSFTLLIMAAAATGSGCDSVARSPVSPSAPVSPAPAPILRSAAVLVVEDAFVIAGPYYYETRFRLRESGGRSGAVIKRVAVSETPWIGPHITTERCWKDEIRVPTGGTLDTFYTDAGSKRLGYCYAGLETNQVPSALSLEVRFIDDQGVEGAVRTDVTTFREP